jgi:hypothetical protein
MVMRQMVRLSANVPKDIAEQAYEIAATRHMSRSKLISECLLLMIEERKRKLLAEGYRAMAEQHREFANISAHAAMEVLPDW